MIYFRYFILPVDKMTFKTAKDGTHIQSTASGGRKLNYFKQTCERRPMFLNVAFDANHRNSESNKEATGGKASLS
jgi:hypothetical protein